MQALPSRLSRCPSFPRRPTPLTASVLQPGAHYNPQLAHSLAATPRRPERQLARSHRRCSPFCALSSRAARGLGLDPDLGSFRLLSILLLRRRLRHRRFHCSLRAFTLGFSAGYASLCPRLGPSALRQPPTRRPFRSGLTVALVILPTVGPYIHEAVDLVASIALVSVDPRFLRTRPPKPLHAGALRSTPPRCAPAWSPSGFGALLGFGLTPRPFRFARAPPESAPRFLLERSAARAALRSSTL